MSTFIEIQNNLLSEFPGMPRAIVKQAINDAYDDLCRKWPWAAFEQTYPLPLTGPYSSGDAIVAKDSRSVTLSAGTTGAAWTTSMAGRHIRLAGEDQFYKIASATTTTLQLERAYVTTTSYGTITDGTGTVGGSPVTLTAGTNSVTILTAGTFTVELNTDVTGTATSSGWTVSGSPQSLVAGTNTVTVSAGGSGAIYLTLTVPVSYEMFQHLYTLNQNVKELHSVQISDNLIETPRAELDRMDPTRQTTGEPYRFVKLGRKTSGSVQIEVWPVPDNEYLARYRARISPISLTNEGDVSLIDGQLVEAYAWLRIYPKALRLLQDDTLKEMYQDKKGFAEELYGDALMEDTRLHSQYEKIRNVTDGSDRWSSTEFAVDHDVD